MIWRIALNDVIFVPYEANKLCQIFPKTYHQSNYCRNQFFVKIKLGSPFINQDALGVK